MLKPSDPAFPKPDTVENVGTVCRVTEGAPGMSLRTYLAAKAMTAILIGTPITGVGMTEATEGYNRLPDTIVTARQAVAYADALITELNQTGDRS